jgi:predicted porin
MQKKLIAVAVAGLVSTGAMAQVTMYGVADATLDMVKASGSTTAGQDISRFNRVSTNSSLLGVRGTEDLGGGMSAMFQYESSITFDQTGGTLAARDSYVGLGGAFGKVLFGNLTGPTRLHGAMADVYSGATGIGANSALLGKIGNGSLSANGTDSGIAFATAGCGRSATCTSVFDSRWKNSLAYVSPALGPVTLTAVYVANENRTRENLDGTTSQRDTKGFDLGAQFKQGPITAGLSINSAKLGDTASTKATDTRLFGMFDFGMGTVRALYDSVKAEDNTGEVKQTVYGIGATFNVGSGKIVGQYYAAGDTKTDGTKDPDTGAKLFTVGYEHSLSKRTLVKVLVSKLSNDADQAYDYGVNSVGQGFDAAGADLTGFSFGVRHTF